MKEENKTVIHYAGCDSLNDYCNHPNRKCDCEKCDCGAISEPSGESVAQWEKNLRRGDIFAIPVGDSLTPIKELHPLEMEILVKFIKQQLEKLIDSIPDADEIEMPNGSHITADITKLKAQLRKDFL